MHLSHLVPLLTIAAAISSKRDEPAPLLTPSVNATLVPGKYIVKLKDNAGPSALSDVAKGLANDAEHVYENVFQGFATQLNDAELKALRDHPDVDYVELDQEASGYRIVGQPNPPWGLARISHRRRGAREYVYDDRAGRGVCVYVIDTGIDAGHPEFQGRASQIKSFIPGAPTDDNGHGTHVAGTIGSRTYGVAKAATLYGVKVLRSDNRGSWADIIAGMDFVHGDVRRRNCPNGVVVNMSLGGPYIKVGNEAAARLVRAGYFVAVAAGNDNRDSRGYTPASEPSVCTVGGTSSVDKRYAMSNWGPSLDILAPGVDIQSTLPNGRQGIMTGTSMASPHIAGLGAYLAVVRGQRAGPWLCDAMRKLATPNVITDQVRGTVNLLAFNDAT